MALKTAIIRILEIEEVSEQVGLGPKICIYLEILRLLVLSQGVGGVLKVQKVENFKKESNKERRGLRSYPPGAWFPRGPHLLYI